MSYIIEARSKKNPTILNPRPHPWFRVAVADTKKSAQQKAAELREGAREANIGYIYRIRDGSPACALGFETMRKCPNMCKGRCGWIRDI
jgi:hypothetical protein